MKKNNKKQYIHKIPLINKIILAAIILFIIYKIIAQTNLPQILSDAFNNLFNNSSDISQEEQKLMDAEYDDRGNIIEDEIRDGEFEKRLRELLSYQSDSE